MLLSFISPYIHNFAAGCQSGQFFGLLPWYHYLQKKVVDGACVIQFDPLPPSGRSDIILVLLVIIDDLLRVAGLVSIGFIIWGGVLYITSQGSAEQTQRAQSTIQNALLGLVFCIMAIALVTFLGQRIG